MSGTNYQILVLLLPKDLLPFFLNISHFNVFLGFFEGDSKLKDSFLKVADTERDRFKFVWTSNKQVLESNGYNELALSYLYIV